MTFDDCCFRLSCSIHRTPPKNFRVLKIILIFFVQVTIDSFFFLILFSSSKFIMNFAIVYDILRHTTINVVTKWSYEAFKIFSLLQHWSWYRGACSPSSSSSGTVVITSVVDPTRISPNSVWLVICSTVYITLSLCKSTFRLPHHVLYISLTQSHVINMLWWTSNIRPAFLAV